MQRDDHRVGALFIAARQRVGCRHGEIHDLPRARADRAAAAGFDLRRNLIKIRAIGERDLDDAVRVVNFSCLVSNFEGGDGKAVVDRLAVIIVSAAALAAGHDAVSSGPQSRTLDCVLRAFREVLRRGRGGKNFIRALAQRELCRHNAREVCRVGDADEADRAGRAGRRNHRAVLHAIDLDRKFRDGRERLAYDLDAVGLLRFAVLGGHDDLRPVVQIDVALARHINARFRLVRDIRLEAELRRVNAGNDGNQNVGRAILVLRDLHVLHVLVGHVLILNLDGVGEERRAFALDIRVILRRDVIGLLRNAVLGLYGERRRRSGNERNRENRSQQLCTLR